MKLSFSFFSIVPVVCVCFSSCGNSTSNLASKSLKSLKSVTYNLIPSRVPVVKVRKQDLKKMASGADRVVAWDKHLKRWVVAGTQTPIHYNPASLPDVQTLSLDAGILPPLSSEED